MFTGLRITIFWNILLLFVLAVALISFVVLRITQRELLLQYTRAGETVFSAMSVNLGQFLHHNPQALKGGRGSADITAMFQALVQSGTCLSLVLVDGHNIIRGHREHVRIGQASADPDIAMARASGSLYTKTYQSRGQIVVCGPVIADNKTAGILKAAFSLAEVQGSTARASKIIFTYIVLDGIILILFGTFLLSRYLVTPVQRLISLTESVAEGNLDGTPLFLDDKNEISKLSVTLKSLGEKLQLERENVRQQLRALEEKNLQLRQARDEIIQSEKMASIGRLAAGIAHEIGNPLGIIVGYTHMLRGNGLSDGERTDFLSRMEAEVERANAIIGDLLDYARPSSQEIRELSLNDVIRETYTLLSFQKEFRRVKAVFNLAEKLPPLAANEKQIRQVIVNLVMNALDAMPEGGTLTLSTALDQTAGGTFIAFSVADTGEGIDPENLKKVFDPFFTTKKPGKGTGLGLSNVHRIVELAGGSIAVTSTPGSGTTFTVRFSGTGNL